MFRFTIRGMNVAYKKLRISTEYAERRAEEAKEMAAQEKVWSETSKAREREMRADVEQLHKQIQPLVSRIELDKSGRPVVTPLPSQMRPATSPTEPTP